MHSNLSTTNGIPLTLLKMGGNKKSEAGVNKTKTITMLTITT